MKTENGRLDEGIKRFRLAVYCPDPGDGTSLYRGMGPLGAMEKQDPRLELVLPQLGPGGRELTWDWLWRCDAVFVQRPYLPMHSQLLIQANLMQVPVWVDWDDDYLGLHRSHRNFGHFTYPGAEQVQQQLVSLADVVTVTTEELKRRVQERDKKLRSAECGVRNGKVRVVPNACQWPFEDGERLRRVTWRGAHAHAIDIRMVLKDLSELAQAPQFSKWEWAFLGEPPWELVEAMPPERVLGDFGAEPWLYMEALCRLRPWVHIVPLADVGFNRCKSNLAWIEATSAGAITLAADWEEWQRPGIVHYQPKQFGTALREAMTLYGEKEHARQLQLSRDYIREHLMLWKVNEQRWQILNELWTQGRGGAR